MTALAYRLAREHDRPFVVESWLSSYRTAHAAGLIAMDDWHDVMLRQVERVLARPGCETHVACHPGEDLPGADLYGWIATEPEPEPGLGPLVHYCYVKVAYRRMGIARGLLSAAGVDRQRPWVYTCKTGVVSSLPLGQGRWRPLIARFAPGVQNGRDDGER